MAYLLYNTVLALLTPPAKVWLRRQERHRPLLARFAPVVPPFSDAPLWIHACSVGEVGTARPLIAALKETLPNVPILLTTSTVAGRGQADKLNGDVAVTWCPFDKARAVRSFLAAARPRILILIETELWPNLLREARRRQVPIVLVNARLSDKHFKRYLRYRRFFRSLLANVTAVGAQSPLYAERFAQIGVPGERITVTGNTKFDAVATAVDMRQRARLRASHDLAAEDQVLVFGSTRPGDEALAARCLKALQPQFPRLKLIIAPRHAQRIADILPLFDGPVAKRSDILAGHGDRAARILVVDTTGELVAFYALATIAVVGGSFYAGVDGHNPLEPAALGVPTVFGPYMNNFRDPSAALLQQQGAIQVTTPEELAPALERLLRDQGECRRLGTRGRKTVLDHQGAIKNNVELIQRLLAEAAGSDA